MDRRRFLLTSLDGAFAVPLAAGAQQAGKALRDHGYIEGQNILIEWRSAEGRPEKIAGLADELVRLNVAAIVTSGDDITNVVRKLTRTIPIVMATSSDPMRWATSKVWRDPAGTLQGFRASFESYLQNVWRLSKTPCRGWNDSAI